MTRIIAGSAGGRRLETPKGDSTRPTSDRVREALFSVLEARGAVRGAVVLDLFAGSGALGLEAASRGAADVVLVDSSRQAAEAARANVAALGMPRVSVVLANALRHVEGRPSRPVDLAFLDPPYAMGEDDLAKVLAALAAGWLSDDGLVVVERSSRSPEPRWPEGLVRSAVRRYGETSLWLAGTARD
ncbi:MAG: 16S rRNA (guanine(966)-N(2))-methyltransferase RsmD [Actinobacteria bacterium]|nr:16S rRNA (guanine(966)-N(2))-methyltransferase RsmD [Actinomycetota bacterium]